MEIYVWRGLSSIYDEFVTAIRNLRRALKTNGPASVLAEPSGEGFSENSDTPSGRNLLIDQNCLMLIGQIRRIHDFCKLFQIGAN